MKGNSLVNGDCYYARSNFNSEHHKVYSPQIAQALKSFQIDTLNPSFLITSAYNRVAILGFLITSAYTQLVENKWKNRTLPTI